MEPATPNDQGRRSRPLLIVVAGLFVVLVFRLFHLQIATSEDYARASEDNRIDQKRLKAPRGLIRARDGEVLAHNRAFYTITLLRSSRQHDSTAVAALHEAIGGPAIEQSHSDARRSSRLKRDVDFRTVSIVEERLKDEWPLAIEIEAKRAYPEGSLAAHLLGYMQTVQEEDLQAPRSRNYVPGDFIGTTGLEKVYEDILRGEDGARYVEVDARQRILRDFPKREQPATPGKDLRLTIDFAVQKAAEEALPDTLGGSVVALDPETGAILALASEPTFDPNVFVSFQENKERARLLRNDAKPLFNRAISGEYPPGSTLKLVAALAALEEGITDTLSTFAACAGSLQVGDHVFRCFKRDGHGELNLPAAVAASCNIYFLHLAHLLGMESWVRYAAKFGFGQPTGVNLAPEEARGLLPTRQLYADTEGWSLGHLMNLVIGQGRMLATPVQMARYAAALGNGGYLVTPYLHGPPPERRAIEGLSPQALQIVKECMHRVVYGEHGTGRLVQIDGIEVGGKSGTAQVPNRNDDAWFIAFAPWDRPAIAVAVVVEGGGGGGTVAGPIARKVMEAFFARNTLVTGPREHRSSPSAPGSRTPQPAPAPDGRART